MSINETISRVMEEVLQEPSSPLWIRLLAFVGLLWLLQTIGKTGINFVYLGAYIFGLFKFLYIKLIKKGR